MLQYCHTDTENSIYKLDKLYDEIFISLSSWHADSTDSFDSL